MTQPPAHELILYVDAFWVSPWAFSAWVTLTEKGLAFERRELSFPEKEHRDAAYRRRSLTGRVPMLLHGDFALSESSAIAEYLDEAFPETQRALPAEPHERARARQLMAWLRSDLTRLREERPTRTIFYGPAADAPLSVAARDDAERLVGAAEALLDGGAQLFAGGWSIADADMALALQRLLANGDEMPSVVRAFVDAQWRRPSVRAWVEHERPPFRAY